MNINTLSTAVLCKILRERDSEVPLCIKVQLCKANRVKFITQLSKGFALHSSERLHTEDDLMSYVNKLNPRMHIFIEESVDSGASIFVRHHYKSNTVVFTDAVLSKRSAERLVVKVLLWYSIIMFVGQAIVRAIPGSD